MTGRHYLLAALVALAVILGLIWSFDARATNLDGRWDDSKNREWYRAQHNADGQLCCDWTDAEHYTGDYTPKGDGSVVLHLDAGDVTIPASKVLNKPNPTGHAVWWHVGETTYCFAIGPLF